MDLSTHYQHGPLLDFLPPKCSDFCNWLSLARTRRGRVRIVDHFNIDNSFGWATAKWLLKHAPYATNHDVNLLIENLLLLSLGLVCLSLLWPAIWPQRDGQWSLHDGTCGRLRFAGNPTATPRNSKHTPQQPWHMHLIYWTMKLFDSNRITLSSSMELPIISWRCLWLFVFSRKCTHRIWPTQALI